MLQPIFLLMVLIFLNAVFASAEIAVISMSDLKLRQLCEAGDRRAGKLEALIKQPDFYRVRLPRKTLHSRW